MPKEYIEREALIEDINSLQVFITGLRVGKNVLSDYIKHYKESIVKTINEQPTLDVAEVKHGKWIKITGMSPPEYHNKHTCSECGEMALCKKYREELSMYCPNCGAKMDKE